MKRAAHGAGGSTTTSCAITSSMGEPAKFEDRGEERATRGERCARIGDAAGHGRTGVRTPSSISRSASLPMGLLVDLDTVERAGVHDERTAGGARPVRRRCVRAKRCSAEPGVDVEAARPAAAEVDVEDGVAAGERVGVLRDDLGRGRAPGRSGVRSCSVISPPSVARRSSSSSSRSTPPKPDAPSISLAQRQCHRSAVRRPPSQPRSRITTPRAAKARNRPRSRCCSPSSDRGTCTPKALSLFRSRRWRTSPVTTRSCCGVRRRIAACSPPAARRRAW